MEGLASCSSLVSPLAFITMITNSSQKRASPNPVINEKGTYNSTNIFSTSTDTDHKAAAIKPGSGNTLAEGI